jgi:hypothetical protein
MTQGLGMSLQRPACGSNMPIMKWILYADHELAPLRRSQIGSYMPIMKWILYAGQ